MKRRVIEHREGSTKIPAGAPGEQRRSTGPIRHGERANGMKSAGNFRQVHTGEVTGRGSPPRVLTSTNLSGLEDVDPAPPTTWREKERERERERDVSPPSNHLTCLI